MRWIFHGGEIHDHSPGTQLLRHLPVDVSPPWRHSLCLDCNEVKNRVSEVSENGMLPANSSESPTPEPQWPPFLPPTCRYSPCSTCVASPHTPRHRRPPPSIRTESPSPRSTIRPCRRRRSPCLSCVGCMRLPYSRRRSRWKPRLRRPRLRQGWAAWRRGLQGKSGEGADPMPFSEVIRRRHKRGGREVR